MRLGGHRRSWARAVTGGRALKLKPVPKRRVGLLSSDRARAPCVRVALPVGVWGCPGAAAGTAGPLHPEGSSARGRCPRRRTSEGSARERKRQSSWKAALLGAAQDDEGAAPGCGRGDSWLSGPGQLCAQGTGVADLPQAGLGSEAPGRGQQWCEPQRVCGGPRREGWQAGRVAGGSCAAWLVTGRRTAP